MKQLKELIFGATSESGHTLSEDVARCVAGLQMLGCVPGDRIAILMRNCREQLIVTLAAQHVGAYSVQMNWHSQGSELHYVLNDCGARILFAHADLLCLLDRTRLSDLAIIAVQPGTELISSYRIAPERAKPQACDVDWNDWLVGFSPMTAAASPPMESIIYTSGTTGNPKGVRRFAPTPQEVERTERMRVQMTGITAGSRVLVPAPLYHTAPHVFALRAVRKAEVLVIPARFDPVEFMASIERHRITHVYVVPTMFVRLLALPEHQRRQFDYSSLRFALHAGGPCAPSLKRSMIDWWGPIINEYYGSTEAGPSTFCTSADSLHRPGTIGRALDGVTLEAHDEKGHPLPAGEIGELFVRNDNYPDFTYLNRADERVALQRGDLMATGDMGYHDDEGYWFLCDRKRDLVISGGVNIYPAEIEAVILEMSDVADYVVFGIPDDEFGEGLAALIEPIPGKGVNPEKVIGHLRARLAAFKLPRLIEQRDQLPRDEAGKIKKRLLREPYWQSAGRRI